MAGFTLASAANVVPSKYAVADLSGPDGSISLDLTITVNMAFDPKGNLYVMNMARGGSASTAKLYKISGNTVSLYANLGAFMSPDAGIRSFTVADNGDVFIAGGYVVSRYSANGTFSTVAGYKFTWTGPAPDDLNPMIDGPVATGRFAALGGIAVDSSGTIFVTDANSVRMIKDGQISTVAGFKKFGAGYGYVDGQGDAVRFNNPFGIAFDSFGNLYICDSSNQVIRKMTQDGRVTTVAGTPGVKSYADGPLNSAGFNLPSNIAVGPLGDLYVSDLGNAQIRRVSLTTGTVSTVVSTIGPDVPWWYGNAFSNPISAVSDKGGNLFILDQTQASMGSNNPSWILRKADPLVTANGRIINLSGRSTTGSGAATMIAGVVVKGSVPVELRGIGPTLGPLGVPHPVSDPKLDVYDANRVLGPSNDNWGGDKTIIDVSARVGAFALPADSKDAALYLPSMSGLHTMFVTGNAGDGTALAEIYDASPSPGPVTDPNTPRLMNISLRGQVTSTDPLIGGFVITGAPRTVLIRGIGPTLGTFGVDNALSDSVLTLYAGQTALARNDNWGGDQVIANTATQVGAFGLAADSKDAVLLVTLQPGAYTAIVTGANGATGTNAQVEIYEVTN